MRLLDYELPEALIAQHPAEKREASRLLVVDRARDGFTDTQFAHIGSFLRPHDLLIVNETRVRPARLFLQRATGGRIEMLFVRPAGEAGQESWRVLSKPAKHAPIGARLSTPDG
ncbi:MAG: S-adenosylmethionine:tRNA ribosyltransferase-isomerase, partial [Candidatus Eisenbacteria bacterium]|nr:S-adenosylmethionine:tRNA ribosyltransferase-isomerase [Candidatus Eisenbacteria bacterium]